MADWFSDNAPASSAPKPTGDITPVDPGVYKDSKGNFFTGTSLSDAVFRGTGYLGGGNFSGGPPAAAPVNYGTPTTPPDVYQSSPNVPRYDPLPTPAALATPYVAPTWQGGDYVAPTKPASLQSEYVLPTQAELEATPGYQARLTTGLQAGERSAAAKGSVLSGGTQKALARYGQDYASGEYGNLVGQQLAARGENVAEYSGDASRAYQDYTTRYGQFLDSANLGLGARQQNQSEFTTARTATDNTFKNRYQEYLDDNARTLSDYTTNVNTRRNANNDYWTHLKDLYSGGQSTAAGSYVPPL